MFDLPCGVRLRAFRTASPSSNAPGPAGTSAPDIDHILAMYNDTAMAPLLTQRFIVPRGAKLKEDFEQTIERDAEMFCVIESIPIAPPPADAAGTGAPQPQPRFLGFTALWAQAERGHRHANFSIALFPEAQGRGVGTAVTRFVLERAFVHLNMHRVSLSAFAGNERALAVYRKCGFVDEGRQRKAYWVAGQWMDWVNMGILIDDWTELQKAE